MSFSSEAITLIDAIASKLGIAINWSSENILPVLQDLASKYIKWEISTSIAWIVFCLMIEIILISFIYADLKKWRTEVITVFFGLGTIAPSVAIIVQVFDIIKCCTFPELQIIQFLQQFIRSLGNHL